MKFTFHSEFNVCAEESGKIFNILSYESRLLHKCRLGMTVVTNLQHAYIESDMYSAQCLHYHNWLYL